MTKSKLETIAIHGGQQPDPMTGAVMPPIVLSTTFAQDGPGVHKGYEYARTGNPTRDTLERCVAALERATHGVAFSSGCAAMTALFQTVGPGDAIAVGDDVYGGTYRILERVIRPLGVEVYWFDATDAEAASSAIKSNCKLLFLETPTNPMMKLTDIRRLVALAKDQGPPEMRVAVDNTFATPILQQPLELGADIVVHSTTKYLNGHSDVVGGCLATNDGELATQLRFLQNATGAVPSPFDCFLVLRGLKTLPVRMERHVGNAKILAEWLAAHPKVERVYYPGLTSHPQHRLAQHQMRGPGGMMSFVVTGGLAAATAVLKRVQLFVCAESLGGVESLIEHPAIMTHGSVPVETREGLGIVDGLLRVSVGLEAVTELQADLEQALAAI